MGAEKSGATKPGQRRVFGYATIWGAKLVGLAAAAVRRVNGNHERTAEAEQGESVGRRPSNVHCAEERLAGPANEEKRGRLPKGAPLPQATFQKNASFQTCLACVNVGP